MCNHTVVLTLLQLVRITVIFYQRDLISLWLITCQYLFYMYVDIAFSVWNIATKVCGMINWQYINLPVCDTYLFFSNHNHWHVPLKLQLISLKFYFIGYLFNLNLVLISCWFKSICFHWTCFIIKMKGHSIKWILSHINLHRYFNTKAILIEE